MSWLLESCGEGPAGGERGIVKPKTILHHAEAVRQTVCEQVQQGTQLS